MSKEIVTESQLIEKFYQFRQIDLDDDDAVAKYLDELASYKGKTIVKYDENIDYKKLVNEISAIIEIKIRDEVERTTFKRRISKDRYEWLQRNMHNFEKLLEKELLDDLYGYYDVIIDVEEEQGKFYIDVIWTAALYEFEDDDVTLKAKYK